MANDTKAAAPVASGKRNEMREATGDSAIRDAAPGTTMSPDNSLHFEGLGYLEDFPEQIDTKDVEGVGTVCVVLSDILSGAGGETYQKGQLHRISKLVQNYDETNPDVKASIRRLVSLKAIRHATPEEIEAGFAVVNAESESEATQNERTKRLKAEADNQALRKELAALKGTPEPEAPKGPTTKQEDPFSEE